MSTQTQPVPISVLIFAGTAILAGTIGYLLLTTLQRAASGGPEWWAALFLLLPVAVIVGLVVWLYLTKDSR